MSAVNSLTFCYRSRIKASPPAAWQRGSEGSNSTQQPPPPTNGKQDTELFYSWTFRSLSLGCWEPVVPGMGRVHQVLGKKTLLSPLLTPLGGAGCGALDSRLFLGSPRALAQPSRLGNPPPQGRSHPRAGCDGQARVTEVLMNFSPGTPWSPLGTSSCTPGEPRH